MPVNIFTYRRNLGLSQAQLGKMCGITQQAINRIEKGITKPSFDTLIKLAEALGVTVNDLVA